MKTKNIIIAVAALVVGAAANTNEAVVPVSAMTGPIEVRVDPNFELIGMVCHLAGYAEYGISGNREEREAVRERFGSYTNHPTVKAFAEYRKKFYVGYDAPASLSVHLKPDLSGYFTSLDPWPERLDGRWKKADLEKIRRQLVEFRDASRFGEWYVSRTGIYSARIRDTIKQLGGLRLPEWLSRYYGPQKYKSRLRVVVTKLPDGHNFGVSVQVSDDEVLYSPVISCNTLIYVLPHEFSHPFTDAPGKRILRELEAKCPDAFAGFKKEFGNVKDLMARQAYGSIPIWWGESFNRANEMRYFRSCLPKYEDRSEKYRIITYTDMVEYLLEGYEKKRGFALVRPLYNLLDKYEADREKYKTIDDFVPVVVDYLIERFSKTG